MFSFAKILKLTHLRKHLLLFDYIPIEGSFCCLLLRKIPFNNSGILVTCVFLDCARAFLHASETQELQYLTRFHDIRIDFALVR